MESIRRLLYCWLLLPLTGLLVLTALLGYPIVLYPVTDALDWALMDSARSLARLIKTTEGYATLTVLPENETMLRSDEYDRIYYSIHSSDGALLAGDAKVALTANSTRLANPYYDSIVNGEPVRVAVMTIPRNGKDLIIQVAETTVKRTRLAGQILTGVILIETVLIITVALLVSIGIRRGLAPLQRLRNELEARSSNDLRPVPEDHAPIETQPVVKAINGLIAQLATALQAQQLFVANAAHQLRTPLAGLRMQIEYALRQEKPEEWRRALTTLMPLTERTVHLAHQLLTLARTEANSVRGGTRSTTDLAAIVQDAAAPCMPKAIEREIDLGLELRPTLIVGDPFLLGELVTNLIDNAVTYGFHGSRVTVRVACREGASVLEVEDEGPGIEETERDKIFQRFYRTVGSAGDGCGLGLAIVREIAQLHHAHVGVGHAPSRHGSIFTVTFPQVST